MWIGTSRTGNAAQSKVNALTASSGVAEVLSVGAAGDAEA